MIQAIDGLLLIHTSQKWTSLCKINPDSSEKVNFDVYFKRRFPLFPHCETCRTGDEIKCALSRIEWRFLPKIINNIDLFI